MNTHHEKRINTATRRGLIWITTVLAASLLGSTTVVLARSEIAPRHSAPKTAKSAAHTLPSHPLIEQKLRSIIKNPQLRKSFQSALSKLEENRHRLSPILVEAGIPHYLLAIPIVESRFNPSAGSSRLNRDGIPRSLGVWQMIPSTARKLGLLVNRKTDQRRELIKETRAASQLLRSLYDQFGSWPLAITAYHLGSLALQEVLSAHPGESIFELISNEHISDYTIKIYAAAHFISDPQPLKLK